MTMLPSIPRLYTALAEVLAVLLYARRLRPAVPCAEPRSPLVWAAVLGNLSGADRLCAAGVVGALYALRGAAALRVPVGQPGGQLAGGTVHHRPGVSAGRVCCQRRMAAALLAVPAPERL